MHTWLHVAFALISKQAHLLMTAHAVNTVQVKVTGPVNGTAYMAMGYFAYWPTAALIGYAAQVCVEYGPVSCQSM